MVRVARYQQEVASTDLSLPRNTYIYSLITCAPRATPYTFAPGGPLAAISSDDSLRFIDITTLTPQFGFVDEAHRSVTCLSRFDDEGNVVVTSGRDGYVRFWDRRICRRATQIVTREWLFPLLYPVVPLWHI